MTFEGFDENREESRRHVSYNLRVEMHGSIHAATRAVLALAPALLNLEREIREVLDFDRVVARGYFTPEEDGCLRHWFARYLTTRAALRETVEDLRPAAEGRVEGLAFDRQLERFLVAFTAAALLVRAGRCLVADVAPHRMIQRKLNEPEPRFRIPGKQFTAVRRSLTSPVNAWRLWHAMRFADEHRDALDSLQGDPILAPVLEVLRASESSMRVPARIFLRGRLRYRIHAWRQRRVSAVQQGIFAVAEAFGRVASEVRTPGLGHRVGVATCECLEKLLQPGDVLVTRHDQALTNLFLPGYWPHASLYLGPASVREALGVQVDAERMNRWSGPNCVLEARKDGVLFRPLEDTLAVDAVVVIRPQISSPEIARALGEATTHEGKLYDFDFDFFRSDRIVCTEVVYRAFDGVGGIQFALTQRGGRPTLSAEDVLKMAMAQRGFEPIAIYGSPGCEDELVAGAAVRSRLGLTLGETRSED